MNTVTRITFLALILFQTLELGLSDKSAYRDLLHSWFTGTFHNKDQVEQEKQKNIKDIHECVKCQFIPIIDESSDALEENKLLESSYYLEEDGLFRKRLYEFIAAEGATHDVLMKIYKPKDLNVEDASNEIVHPDHVKNVIDIKSTYEYIPHCDMCWDFVGNYFIGTLKQSPCIITSEKNPTEQIEIREDAKIKCDTIEINDRVLTLDGTLLHGHKGGIPYRYSRIN
mmetsp:Transcript_5130/g.5256  ORF Transcript_5130/g.5256 Transcript_5130/m.5256 type:complete len:227 (+) Transcript_5130:80-760(+)